MTSDKKKIFMLVIVAVCFALVVAITVYRRHVEGTAPTGVESIKHGDMIWVKCEDPKCGAEYQMDKREYFEYLQDHPPTAEEFAEMMSDPNMKGATALVCNKCKKKTIYRAEKCEKCGIVFIRGSVKHDYADRCPECNYSKTEAQRKKPREVLGEKTE